MSANDKAAATYGPGRTTPPLEARIADVLAHNRCRANNPKADHPIWGYLTFSEDQREFLRGQQAQTVAELMPLIGEAQAEAFDDGVDETFHQSGSTLSEEVLSASKYANFYRSNDE